MVRVAIPYGMVTITEDDAAAIRDAFHKGGEVPAAAELRRRFPEIADTVEARRAAQTIAERATPPDLTIETVKLVLAGNGVLILKQRPEPEVDVRMGLLQALDVFTTTPWLGPVAAQTQPLLAKAAAWTAPAFLVCACAIALAAPVLAQSAIGSDAGGAGTGGLSSGGHGGRHGGGRRQRAASAAAPAQDVPQLKRDPVQRLDPGALLCRTEAALLQHQAMILARLNGGKVEEPTGCQLVRAMTAVAVVERHGLAVTEVRLPGPPEQVGWTDSAVHDGAPDIR